MMDYPTALPRDLGDGLVLRHATPADAEALATFNAEIHAESGSDTDEGVRVWTRDLMTRPHPTFPVSDFTLVEDTRAGRIASSLNLISQTWTYDGIPFGVGRPELVGTYPDYRNRGLVRVQMEVIHQWSAARGELAQAITGIPFYYRLFGYEMALELGGGGEGYAPNVPSLKEDEDDPYVVREAREDDLPFIAALDEAAAARSLVFCLRDEALWRYELSGRSLEGANSFQLCVVETTAGERVATLRHPTMLWGPGMACTGYEVAAGQSWLAITPSVIRYLWQVGQRYAERDDKERKAFFFAFGTAHPAYEAVPEHLPHMRKPYAWYVRVPDLPAFLRRVAPALERRLADSVAVGHSGALRLNFYRSGVQLAFEGGRLTTVEPWRPTYTEDGDAAFPGQTFLQLLVGYRSLAELRHAFPDVWYKDNAARVLLDALFPARLSAVWPIS